MITKNFKALMALILQSSNNNTGTVPVKGVNGTTYYATNNLAFPKNPSLGFTLSETAAGISFGTSGTAATEDDYKLGSAITSGLSASVLHSSKMESDGPSSTLKLNVTNTSGSSITIREVGFKQTLAVSSTQGVAGTGSVVCLLDHTILSTPLTIASGDSAILNYKLKTLTSGSGGGGGQGGGGGSSPYLPGGGDDVWLTVLQNPTKAAYSADTGYTLDLSGVKIGYHSVTEGTTTDVTASCTFSPASGSTLTPPASGDSTQTITVTYGDLSTTITVLVSAASAGEGNLRIHTMPSIVAYNNGTGYTLNYSGAKVMYKPNSNSEEQDVTSACTFTPASGTVLTPPSSGNFTQQVTVMYNGYTATFNVIVEADSGTLRIATYPRRTYNSNTGYTFTLSGITVMYKSSPSGGETDVTSECTFSKSDGTQLTPPSSGTSTQTITVTYGMYATSFTITIEALAADTGADGSKLRISSLPRITTYDVSTGYNLDLDGLVVTYIDSNGGLHDVRSDATYSPARGAALTPPASGSTEVTVSASYNGLVATFTVTVMSDGSGSGITTDPGIAVTRLPNITTYNSSTGYVLNLDGIEVTYTGEHGATVDVTDRCWYDPDDGATLTPLESAATRVTVHVRYYGDNSGGRFTSFDVLLHGRNGSTTIAETVSTNDTTVADAAYSANTAIRIASFPNCTSIGNNAFADCSNLEVATFPECITIAYGAFLRCTSLTSVSFPKCQSIGYEAFLGCGLSSAAFPECKTVGGMAFTAVNGLQSISLPKCQSIGAQAFETCRLYTMSLPVCSFIDDWAFRGCFELKSFYLGSTSVVTLGGSSVFASYGGLLCGLVSYSTARIYVPASLVNAYKTAQYWSSLASKIVSM